MHIAQFLSSKDQPEKLSVRVKGRGVTRGPFTPKKELVKAEHSLKQKYPKKHGHYSFEDFFHFQPERGTVTDWNESRNIFTSEDFIIGLVEGLEEEVGEASGVVMYNIGYEWGLRDAKFFQQWFEKEYEKNTREVNSMFMLEAWW